MKTYVAKWVSLAVVIASFQLVSFTDAMANPCCIIVVPPPPPPPPPKASHPAPNVYGSVYATLPVELAVKLRLFSPRLKVDIQSKPFPEAVNAVLSAQGTLAIGPIDALARYKANTRADVEIAGVLVNRPYY